MKPKKTQEPAAQKATPNREMQMEDAGTPASGNSGMGGRADAAEAPIKQLSGAPEKKPGKQGKRGSH